MNSPEYVSERCMLLAFDELTKVAIQNQHIILGEELKKGVRRNGLAELASLESADFGLEPPQVGRRTFSD